MKSTMNMITIRKAIITEDIKALADLTATEIREIMTERYGMTEKEARYTANVIRDAAAKAAHAAYTGTFEAAAECGMTLTETGYAMAENAALEAVESRLVDICLATVAAKGLFMDTDMAAEIATQTVKLAIHSWCEEHAEDGTEI